MIIWQKVLGRKHRRRLPTLLKTKHQIMQNVIIIIFRILLNCYGYDKMEEISR